MVKGINLTRRQFLRGAGATLILAVGGSVYRAVEQGVFQIGEGPAYEPWHNWRDEMNGPLSLVKTAVLASNPHNAQPWLFAVSDNQVDLYADMTRTIGTVDPLLREMHLGLGCALENMLLTAEAIGYEADVTLVLEEKRPYHIATIKLQPTSPHPTPLYDAIPHRRTNRGAYDTNKPVPQDTLDAMQKLGDEWDNVHILWFTSDDEKSRVGQDMIAATEALIHDEEQSADSFHWVRDSWEEI